MDFGIKIYTRVSELLDEVPKVPTDRSLTVDRTALRNWGDTAADLLLELRFERASIFYEKPEEISEIAEHLTQKVATIADYLHRQGDPAHRRLDEILAQAYWHLLGKDRDTVSADRHFRRAGASVGFVSARAISQGEIVARFAQAEHYADGVGVDQDLGKARRLFRGIDEAFETESATLSLEAARLWSYSVLVRDFEEADLDDAHRMAVSTWRCGFLPALTVVARFEQQRGVEIVDPNVGDEDAGEEDAKDDEEDSEGCSLEDELVALDAMVGLASVKEQVRRLVAFESVQALRRKRGLASSQGPSRHLVLTGNPGTGKTTVARILARIFHLLGVLETDTFVETDRSGLVGGYLGQTAIKTAEVIDSARGGMLFIDEAYALSSDDNDSYGLEAINILLKAMEDYRSELVVVAAGYTEEMERFLESNPGLRSRFNTTIAFDDYSPAERVEILQRCAEDSDYGIDDDALALAEDFFNATIGMREATGNGRFVRNFYEACVDHHATRLHQMAEQGRRITTKALSLLTVEDIRQAARRHDAELPEAPSALPPPIARANPKSAVAGEGMVPLQPIYLNRDLLGVNW